MKTIRNIRADYMKENTPEIYRYMIDNNLLESHLEACIRQYKQNLRLYERTSKDPLIAREMAQAELRSNFLGEVGDYKNKI